MESKTNTEIKEKDNKKKTKLFSIKSLKVGLFIGV
jgi:hypothetical protein